MPEPSPTTTRWPTTGALILADSESWSGRPRIARPWQVNFRLCAELMNRRDWFKGTLVSTTGEGSSDPHYTWGAMLVLVALEELIDINPWHGLRFGNLDPVADAGIERYYVSGSLYDVSLSLKHLEVRRDGRFLLTADG